MKNVPFILMLIIGILLIPLMLIHWLFLIAAVFAIISAFLFKKK
jgi:hypothetical protein